MSWLQTTTGGFVNLDRMDKLEVTGSGTQWRINASWGSTSAQLFGVYASDTDALLAARRLCLGVDPTTVTGGTP